MDGDERIREALDRNVKAVTLRPGMARGTARTRAVLRPGLVLGGPAAVAMAYSRFDERTREDAHAEYLASIAPFARGAGFAIPGEFVVALGR
jgi:hypothetical protein